MNFEPKIVKREQYNGYEYFIVYVDGRWYCAYVIIPEGHPLFEVHYDNITDIETHCGFTFSNYHRLANYQWCIGWDYNHVGDYNSLLGNFLTQFGWFGEPSYKWTPEEIEEDCKYVIDQLNEKYGKQS